MGPEATNRLCALITAHTPVSRDQDHIPVICFNNSRIPDRVGGVAGLSDSPLPEMVRTARVLEDAGADLLLMPCNLAHYYVDELRAAVAIPFLDMIEETVRFTVESQRDVRMVGLLASTPTVSCGLYDRAFARRGRQVIVPDDDMQTNNVMEAIYGVRGIKCGYKSGPRALLRTAAESLAARGAEIVIAGCTEISLVLRAKEASYLLIDPLEILARSAVAQAAGTAQKRAKATAPAE